MKKSFLSTTRILFVLLVSLIMVFAFSACSEEAPKTSNTTTATIEPVVSTVAPKEELVYSEDEFIVEGTTIVEYIGDGGKVEIPAKITAIGDMAFSGCSNVTGVTFTKDVVSIGEKAFENCTGLSSDFVVPSNLANLGDYAFAGCTGITEIEFQNKPIVVGTNIFEGCTSLKKVIIPKTFGVIPDYTFVGCTSLTEVQINNEITTIGNNAFEGCTSLETLVLPSKLAAIGDYAFKGCNKLASFTAEGQTTSSIETKTIEAVGFNALSDTKWFEDTKSAAGDNKYIMVGRNVIIYYLDNSNPTDKITLNIPDEAYVIASGSFDHCIGKIEAVVFGAGSNLTNICEGVFENATALTSFITPTKITTINDDVFSGCVNLAKFTFPNKLTYIGENAFKGCAKLTFVNANSEAVTELPNDIITIGDNAFYGCTALTEITLPDAITDLGDYAFANCTNISKFIIPLKLANVGVQAFDNTKWYNDLSNGMETLKENRFHIYGDGILIKADIVDNTAIVIPEEVKYIASFTFANWGTIGDREFYNSNLPKSITIPDGVTSIGDYAFYFCGNLETVVIAESVTNIGEKAFYGCKNLKVINIPQNIKEIKDYAFYGCSSLPEITLPAQLTSIGSYAFYDCYNLTEIEIPATVNYIGSFAFENTPWFYYNTDAEMICGDGVLLKLNSHEADVVLSNNVKSIVGGAFESGDITSITLPAAVTNIPEYAFNGCTNLTKVIAQGALTEVGNRAFNGCDKITEFNAGSAKLAADAYENSALAK